MTHEEYQPQHDPHEPQPETEDLERGFQVEHISNKTVLAWISAILGLGLLAVVVSFALWAWLEERTPQSQRLTSDELEALDPHQRQTRLKFDEEQRDLLHSYGWVESEREIARIPIDRAMDLLIERTKTK